jgi:hypothetical protein
VDYFNVIDQFWSHQILQKKWECNGIVHQLFTDLRKAYGAVRRQVLYNIPIEFGIQGCIQKFSSLVTWSKNCKWYSSLPLGAVVLLFCESV